MAALRVHGRLPPLLLSLLQLSRVSATCYWPNHTVNAEVTYQTCGNGPSSDTFSMCCALQNRFAGSNDICGKNGLCGNAHIGNTTFWRESCTDRTWQSESCLKLCITGLDQIGKPMNAGDRMVVQCPNKSFCCKDVNSTCCDDGRGLWIDSSNYELRNYDPALTTTSSSSRTAQPISTFKPSAQPSATVKPSPSNTPAIAGGTVGGIGGLVVLLGLAWFLCRRRIRRKSRGSDGRTELHEANSEYPWHSGEKDGTELVEMEGNNGRSRDMELEGSDPRANMELAGTDPRSNNWELEGHPLVQEPGQAVSTVELDNKRKSA